jgi:hypothetical protein
MEMITVLCLCLLLYNGLCQVTVYVTPVLTNMDLIDALRSQEVTDIQISEIGIMLDVEMWKTEVPTPITGSNNVTIHGSPPYPTIIFNYVKAVLHLWPGVFLTFERLHPPPFLCSPITNSKFGKKYV